MSHKRNIKWLNEKRIIYKQFPLNDIPTYSTQKFEYYENGTYEYYHLFNSHSKITTYKSLKWHFLVLYYLNIDGIDEDEISLEDDLRYIFKFIADKENGFVTFFIKNKLLESMIEDVLQQGGDAPKNRKRKIIFKEYNLLTFREKMKIVGELTGRKKITKEEIYLMMLDINESGIKISIQYLAELLRCSPRTLHRNMGKELKQEKDLLNEKI